MNIAEITNAEEKEFSRFRVEVACKPSEFYSITFYDKTNFINKEFVGSIYGGVSEEFYTVDNIMIAPNYQGRGYSKFLYKHALELAKKNGYRGLIVGEGLLMPKKSQATYRNFEKLQPAFEIPFASKRIILTEWAPGKKED